MSDRRFFLVFLVLVLLAAPARAEFDQSFSYDAEALRVGNLIGAITVEGHAGSNFEVEVSVHGDDAEPGVIEFDSNEGSTAELFVLFPEGERNYVYPEMGPRSRSRFSQGRDSGWWGEMFGRDTIEVRGSGRGMELWADITIKVPAGGELFVKNGAGEIYAKGVNGHLELATKVGRIEAIEIDGSLLADTGSGSVEIDTVKGDLLVDTGSGSVDVVNVVGDKALIDTGSGSVRLRGFEGKTLEVDTGSGRADLEQIVALSVLVDTGSGSVDVIDVQTDELAVDTGSGSVRVDLTRMGSGDFDIDTGSGSITFTMPTNASAYVEADTGSGGVSIDVDGVEMHRKKRDHAEFEVGSGDANVRLDTGSGGIRVAMR